MQKLFATAILILCLTQALGHLGHNCIHDDLDHKVEFETSHLENEKIARRDLAGENWGPLRIKARYDNLTGISDSDASYIKNKLMPDVIAYFGNILQVKQITTKLTFGAGVCMTTSIPQNLSTTGEVADLVLLVTAQNNAPDLFAWASPCRINNDGRPILGQVNFNPAYISSKPSDYASAVTAVKHEITHVLGFSKTLYGYFNTGAPIGQSVVTTQVTSRGSTKNAINTTRVVQVARKHFGCENITSVELENEGTGSTAGTHWERSIFFDETMTGVVIPNGKYSHFTLALLEDSGWYKANYSQADPLAKGYQKGCEFLSSQCIDKATKTTKYPDLYCANVNQKSCTPDGSSKGLCYAGQNNNSVFNYFGDNTVGLDSLMDECPVVLNYDDGKCGDTTQNAAYWIPEKFGDTSKCFSGTLLDNRYVSDSIWLGCYPSTCKQLDGVNRLYVTLKTNEYLCPLGGGKITNVPGYNGYITCPSEKQYCAVQPPIINPNVA